MTEGVVAVEEQGEAVFGVARIMNLKETEAMGKTDIVERLRDLDVCDSGCGGRCTVCPQDVVREAADEIERLRSPIPDAAIGEGELEVPSGRDAPSDEHLAPSALKGCAHCASTAFRHENDWCEPHLYSVTCSRCFAGTTEYDTPWKADDAWNKRAVDAVEGQVRSAEREVVIPELESKPIR